MIRRQKKCSSCGCFKSSHRGNVFCKVCWERCTFTEEPKVVDFDSEVLSSELRSAIDAGFFALCMQALENVVDEDVSVDTLLAEKHHMEVLADFIGYDKTVDLIALFNNVLSRRVGD